MKRNLDGEYKVTLEDGSSKVFFADNKTDARRQMNKYLTDYCGYDGPRAGRRPAIQQIERMA